MSKSTDSCGKQGGPILSAPAGPAPVRKISLHNIVFPGAGFQTVSGAGTAAADRVEAAQADLHPKAEADQILDDRRTPAVAQIAQDRLPDERMHSFLRHRAPQKDE